MHARIQSAYTTNSMVDNTARTLAGQQLLHDIPVRSGGAWTRPELAYLCIHNPAGCDFLPLPAIAACVHLCVALQIIADRCTLKN